MPVTVTMEMGKENEVVGRVHGIHGSLKVGGGVKVEDSYTTTNTDRKVTDRDLRRTKSYSSAYAKLLQQQAASLSGGYNSNVEDMLLRPSRKHQHPSTVLDSAEPAKSYAAQLRACMQQFHAARKRRRSPGGGGGKHSSVDSSSDGDPTAEPPTAAGGRNSNSSGDDDHDDDDEEEDELPSKTGSSKSNGAEETANFVERLARLQRSLSDGIHLNGGRKWEDYVERSGGHSVRYRDTSLSPEHSLSSPSAGSLSTKSNNNSAKTSPLSSGTSNFNHQVVDGKDNKLRMNDRMNTMNVSEQQGGNNHNNDNEKKEANDPNSGDELDDIEAELFGKIGGAKAEKVSEGDIDAEWFHEFAESSKLPEEEEEGEHFNDCFDHERGASRGEPKTPEPQSDIDDAERARAVTETIMKARHMGEEILKGAPKETQSETIGRLKAALESAANDAAENHVKLAEVEEESNVQHLLLRAALSRQTELSTELDKTRKRLSECHNDIQRYQQKHSDSLLELKRCQRTCIDMAAGRRSARAALAEMASQNARLVAAYSEKKQELRRLSAEVDVKRAAGQQGNADVDSAALASAQDKIILLQKMVKNIELERDDRARSSERKSKEMEALRVERKEWLKEKENFESRIRRLEEEKRSTTSGSSTAETEPSVSETQVEKNACQSDLSDKDRENELSELKRSNSKLLQQLDKYKSQFEEQEKEAKAHQQYRLAEQHKSKGNHYFHGKRYQEAHDEYTKGIVLHVRDSRLKSILYSNRAAASQHLGRFCDAVVDCCLALEADPGYNRALQRRAEAFTAMGHYDGAYADLSKLSEQGDREATGSLSEARRRAKRSHELDHYAVLGLGASATNQEIKSAYRKLALRLHPDKAQSNGEKEAADTLFKHVAEAHRVLGSPGKRRKFDASKAMHRAFRSHSFHFP